MVDDARFERVYAAHGPAVLRYCTYSLGSRDSAEDAAAEAFARFIERGEHVGDDRVEAWLIRVSRNLCTSHHRAVARNRRLVARMEETAPVADGWTDPDWWHALRVLSESERLTVYLRVVEDLSFIEVARIMGKREGAAKMMFYRAVEKLRGQYADHGIASSASLAGGVSHE